MGGKPLIYGNHVVSLLTDLSKAFDYFDDEPLLVLIINYY